MIVNASKRNTLETSIHFISWLLIFGFPVAFMDRDSKFDLAEFLRHSCVPLFYFGIFYLNYCWFVPYYFFTSQTKKFLVANTVTIITLSILLHLFMENFLTPPPIEMAHKIPPRWIFYFRDMAMLIFVAGLSTAIKTSLKWRQTEEQLTKAEKQKTEAELKNLKNQINPHFLLNTLNNIYALIAINGDKAQNAVQELSKLLRYVLYDNQQNFVPLEKELDFIRNYIELMRIRLTSKVRLTVNIEVDQDASLLIAPLIFISLIENAFKHGISPTEDSFIHISIYGHNDGSIGCAIVNSNYPKSASDKSGSGVGLEQVSKRLEMIYPGNYSWKKSIDEEGKIYSSVLTINTKNNETQLHYH